MSTSYRRFEMLLPLQFNDGQQIPGDLIGITLIELREHFGGVSSETQIIQGQWTRQDKTFRDNLMRVFVDVPDVPESREFFIELKETLKARFRQLDLWITTYPIEVV